MYYAIGTNDTIPPEDGWNEDIPTGTNVGNYYVWYKVTGDMNHNDIPPACIVMTITEAAKPVQPAPAAPTSDYTLLASLKTSGKKALKMSWTAVPGAEGYDIFFGQCSKGDSQYLASVNGLNYKIKGLKKGVAYNAYGETFSPEIPTAVNAGEYTVYYKITAVAEVAEEVAEETAAEAAQDAAEETAETAAEAVEEVGDAISTLTVTIAKADVVFTAPVAITEAE